jgi:hypothetical protein
MTKPAFQHAFQDHKNDRSSPCERCGEPWSASIHGVPDVTSIRMDNRTRTEVVLEQLEAAIEKLPPGAPYRSISASWSHEETGGVFSISLSISVGDPDND